MAYVMLDRNILYHSDGWVQDTGYDEYYFTEAGKDKKRSSSCRISRKKC